MPVSLACFGSGLFNELEKTLDKLEAEGREGDRERGRKGGESACVCGGNHMVSQISEAVSTHKVQAPSTPQHRLPI